jgi:hypothetical protein
MCCKTRSSFCILDTGCREYFLAEIAVKLVGSAQIDLSTTEKFRKVSLHSGQIEETRRLARLELNQKVDVAVLPKLALKSGPNRESLRIRFLLQKSAILSRGSSISFLLAILAKSFDSIGVSISKH